MPARRTISLAVPGYLLLSAILLTFPVLSLAADSASNLARENSIVASLRTRGLVGGNLTEDSPSAVIPAPPPGAEVRVYDAGRADQPLTATMTEWEEPLGNNILAFMIIARDGARQVTYWVLPGDSTGCIIYSYRIFDKSGHVVRSEFWRSSDLIKTAYGQDFPASVYPFGPNGGMPPGEVIRALGTPGNGASATMYTQFSPDSYVTLDVWVDGADEITTPAGKFQAVRIKMRPNVHSFLPSWPGFVLKAFQPFLPKETFYFEANPPYRFLAYQGVPGATGPDEKTEIVRYYVREPSGNTARSASTSNVTLR